MYGRPRLFRKFVPESDAVIKGAEHDVHPARGRFLFHELRAQFVVAVAHETALAPGLLPGFVGASPAAAREPEIALELGRVGQQESQPRLGDHGHPAARDRVAGPSVRVERDRDGERAAGRGERRHGLGTGDAGRDPERQYERDSGEDVSY